MAKTIENDTTVVRHRKQWLTVIGIGAAMGAIFWLATLLIGHYIVEPIACRQLISPTQCLNATAIAGNSATILVTVIGLLMMLTLRLRQPMIIAVLSAALLWDLAAWTTGLFWAETLGWSVLLYVASFALFGWIVRYWRLPVVVALSLVIVLLIRIAASL